MTLTRRNNQYFREVPMPGVKLAYEMPSGALFAIHDDGRAMLDDVQLNDADSLALHDYKDPLAFRGYPVPHSGEGPCVVEAGGYTTAAIMGATPDIRFGAPIWIMVHHPDKGTVRYLLGFAGAVLDSTSKRGIDNHCFPQLFERPTDHHIVYLEGGHNNTIRLGVSKQPYAAYGFNGLHPVGPMSRYTNQGHTYPAARMVGDTLHVVSRFLDGDTSLVYWSVNTKTLQPGKSQVLDKPPAEARYAIWYQQPRVEGDKLIIDTARRWSKTGTTEDLTEPEPETYEVAI